MANTTNLNLEPVDGSSKLKNFPSPYNSNLMKIDTFAGKTFKKGSTTLGSTATVDDDTLFGRYFVNGASGVPSDLAYGNGYLLAFEGVQFLFEWFGSHRIFARYFGNGSWDSWRLLYSI